MMGVNQGQRVGRPRRSSREMIEDAAAELFLEQTYDGTTVEQIAQRAGVSRNTFFNYFASKSDVLWVDVDLSIEHLAAELARPRELTVTEAVREAILHAARQHSSDRVPWAFTQADLMQTHAELQASALSRLLRAATMIERFASSVLPSPRVFAYAVLGATVGAASRWIDAGTPRRPLVEYVEPAITTVCAADWR